VSHYPTSEHQCTAQQFYFQSKHSSKQLFKWANSLMPRLHMQIWQPGTVRKACKKVLSCNQVRPIFCLRSGKKTCFILQPRNFNFKIWKVVFKNVRFRSWSSKPLSVNAALNTRMENKRQKFTNFYKPGVSAKMAAPTRGVPWNWNRGNLWKWTA